MSTAVRDVGCKDQYHLYGSHNATVSTTTQRDIKINMIKFIWDDMGMDTC